jgi:Xaa-Pro aminopeptidase
MTGRIYTPNTILVRGRTIVDESEMPTSYYEERVEKAKHYMRKVGIDVLILAGTVSEKGNYSYFARTLPTIGSSPDSYVLIQMRGGPIGFKIGMGREFAFYKRTTWIRDTRSAAGVRDVIDALKSLKPRPRKIGTLGIAPDKHPTIFSIMQSELKGARFLAQERFIGRMREVKDDREISMLRRACRSIDLEYETLSCTICKGLKEYEAQAKSDRMARLDGARDVRMLWATGPESSGVLMPASERAFVDGDQITVHFANEFGGYWAEMGRVFSLGKPSEEFVMMHDAALKAFNQGLIAVKPGTKASRICKEIRKALRVSGYEENIQEDYGFGHAIGLDEAEPPFIEAYTEDRVKEGMVFSLRVPLYRSEVGSVLIGDTITVTEHGAISLTNSPPELNVLH